MVCKNWLVGQDLCIPQPVHISTAKHKTISPLANPEARASSYVSARHARCQCRRADSMTVLRCFLEGLSGQDLSEEVRRIELGAHVCHGDNSGAAQLAHLEHLAVDVS